MPASPSTEQFVLLMTQYHQRLYLFILSLVPHHSDAEEILQETNLELWRKFDQYRPGSDFRAWSFQIAYFKALSFLDRKKRDRLHFGREFFERVIAQAPALTSQVEERRDALEDCLEKLTVPDRELIRRRYESSAPIQVLAEELGRSVDAVYKAVARIRRALHECVQRAMIAEGRR